MGAGQKTTVVSSESMHVFDRWAALVGSYRGGRGIGGK